MYSWSYLRVRLLLFDSNHNLVKRRVVTAVTTSDLLARSGQVDRAADARIQRSFSTARRCVERCRSCMFSASVSRGEFIGFSVGNEARYSGKAVRAQQLRTAPEVSRTE